MKKWLFAAAAALCCTLAFAQGVTLDNQEDSPFYYVVDPPALAGVTPGSPLMASKVSGYFSSAEAGTVFAAIGPGKQAHLSGLDSGSHLLVGFFAVSDADDYPVRVMSIQVDPSRDRYYTVYAQPAQLVAHKGVGKLSDLQSTSTAVAQAPGGQDAGTQAADGNQGGGAAAGTQTSGTQASGTESGGGSTAAASSAGTGTEEVPTLASFSPSYDPVVFTRETSGSFEVLPISDSRSWKQTGTRITSVQGSLDAQGLRLVLNVPDGFSPSVSYFLYVFDQRAAGTDNAITLEIEPVARGAHGACILWQKNQAPRLLGSVTTGPASVQLDVGAADLAPLASSGAAPTVDLTAGWYDKALGMWEEFYYATLAPTGGNG